MAELAAILNGLSLVWRLNFRQVVLESDSKIALELIKDTSQDFDAQGALLHRIRRFKEMA